MSESVEKLFHTTDIKAFVALFKEIQESYESPLAFLRDAVAYLPTRLYERYYQDSVPQSFFGLMAASRLGEDLLPEETRWRPFVQQCWLATREQKRTPLQVTADASQNGKEVDGRWKVFQEAAQSGNFDEAMASAHGFLGNDEDRDFFRQRSLAYAMEDTLLGGHKFVYLSQAWKLSQTLDWANAANILCPALHFMVVGCREHALAAEVRDYLRDNPLPSLSQNTGEISEQDCQRLESAVLTGTRKEALDALQSVVSTGTSWESSRQALLLGAAQALTNAQTGEWVWPMRAFHFCYSMDQLQSPEDRLRALFQGAALLHAASARSRESNQNRVLNQVIGHLNPTAPLSQLRGLVSHTDPYASATAVYSVLGMENQETALFETLTSLAMKNDGHICGGHDLLFLAEIADCYGRVKLATKERLPVAAGFFLGRVRKSYELAGVYK